MPLPELNDSRSAMLRFMSGADFFMRRPARPVVALLPGPRRPLYWLPPGESKSPPRFARPTVEACERSGCGKEERDEVRTPTQVKGLSLAKPTERSGHDLRQSR